MPSKTQKTLNEQRVLNKRSGQVVRLADLLCGKVNLVHFQNSYRAGQSCRVVMPTIEANKLALEAYGNVVVVVRSDPMDRCDEHPTSIMQVEMSVTDLEPLGVLGPDGYIQRVSFIVDQNGNVLEIVSAKGDELTKHIEVEVLPRLRKFAN
jgi:hypothetical protein